MRCIPVIAVLIGFIGIAVFGPALIEYSMQNHGDCIASAVTGNPCPIPINLIAFLSHHIAAIQALSLSLSPPVFGTTLLPVAFILLAAFLIMSVESNASPQLRSVYFWFRRVDLFALRLRRECIRWLAFHEHSPANP